MPIFMDRHDVKGATPEKVAEVHQKDLQVQAKYGCKGITYWFDEKSGLAFCLIEAPQKKAVIDMHNEAHGLVPNKIIQVEEDAVFSFLGRISDPFKDNKKAIAGVINETGYRTILHMEAKYPYGYFGTLKRGYEYSKTKLLDYLSAKMIKDTGGNSVDGDSSGLMASFFDQNDALKCAAKIQSFMKKKKSSVKISIGISAGLPVSGSRQVFGDTVRTAKNLSYSALPGNTFVSSSLKLFRGNLARQETTTGTIKSLNPDEENFLNNLINYAEINLDSLESGVEHCCAFLGMSKSNLYRKIISLTSYSPNGFFKEFRLKMALKKIIEREGNIAEIAFASGFNTHSYFTQCFKERFGILPSDYLTRIS